MTKKLHIAAELALPLDAVTSTLVVYGGKGMGKSNFASVLMEELAAAGQRFAAIDPMGVLWGLRHDASGKGKGVQALILGGIHADFPIEPAAGELAADLVVDEDVNVIIDISRRPDGTMWSVAERIVFVTAFCKRLYQRQGERRRPLMLVIDEAARFAPQIVRQGELEVAKCIGAVSVIVEEGRNVGIGVTLITQRSARLNKDVAELADCMVAFRTIGPNSMRAVLDWLGEHVEKNHVRDFAERVRSLPRGSALVVSPGWLEHEGIVAMRKRETFDSSATPKAGKEVRASGAGAKPDLDKYRARLAEVIERQKDHDPKALRARVAELERALAKNGAKVKTDTIIENTVPNKAIVTALERSIGGFDKRLSRYESEGAKLASEMSGLQRTVQELIAIIKATRASAPAAPSVSSPPPPRSTIPKFAIKRTGGCDPSNPKPDPTLEGGRIGGGLRRIMIALAQRPSGLTNRQIGIRAGLSSQSGTFSTYLSRARQAGWIGDHGDKRILNETGLAALGHYEPLPTGSALADYWLAQLKSSGAARILRVLLDAYPTPLDNATIGERASISSESGTFSTYMSRLRGLELISGGRGATVASDELFDG